MSAAGRAGPAGVGARAGPLECRLDELATRLGLRATVEGGYRRVAPSLPDVRHFRIRVVEVHIDVGRSSAALQVIDAFCQRRIALDEATRRLLAVERAAPEHNRWMLVAVFGTAFDPGSAVRTR